MTPRQSLYADLVAAYEGTEVKVRPAPDGADPEASYDQLVVGVATIQPGTVVSRGALLWTLSVILVGRALEVTTTDPDTGAVDAPADDHLEALLGDLLAILDDHTGLLWTEAVRSVWRESFPAYTVTVTIADPGA